MREPATREYTISLQCIGARFPLGHSDRIVKEEHIDIATTNGSMNVFITRPDEEGPFPPVIFYMDAPGRREELHDMARRIASVGYYVILPNLYYRDVREFHTGMEGATRERMFELMSHLSNAMICEDTETMLTFLDQQEDVVVGPVGAVGYCMSGPFVFAVAAAFPSRIQAAASIHGVKLYSDDDDSPHLDAYKIQGEIYFGCAEHDQLASPSMIDPLTEYLKETEINARVEWYPDANHGFVFPQREGMYNKAAAERHWSRLFAMFKRNLYRG